MVVRVLQLDLADIKKRLPSEAKARLAASMAINRAMQSGRTAAVKQVAADYAIRQRQVNDKVLFSRATPGALESRVTWRGYALNLSDFKMTPTQAGGRVAVRAMILKSSGMQPYAHAFAVQTRAGVKAYRRVSGTPRYPITGVWGPSLPHLLSAASVKDAIESRASDVLFQRLDHEINRMLK